MKLLKGFLAIALISMIVVSCSETKKGAEKDLKEAIEQVEQSTEEVKEAVEDFKDSIQLNDNKLIDFCCTNHSPKHCARTKEEMSELTEEKNCIF